MAALDPDDPRPPFQQLAGVLRAAILTKKYGPGDQLPSGNDLARTYDVSRATVQDALRVLKNEGLIVSVQGRGVYVRERTTRPVALRPHIERAFEQAKVSIDFAGFSGETLHGAIQEPLDKIRAGRLTPESIAIRMLLPDPTVPWGIPCDAETLSDSPGARDRMRSIMDRHTQAIADSVAELADLGLVKDARTEIKVHGSPLAFKVYIINELEVFFGFYPVAKHTVRIKGQQADIYDLAGKDAMLFHHAADDGPDSIDFQYVEQTRSWFESMWTTVARELVD
jgi:DNA-binding transcriptional regulator YhcF (GntR family)